MKPNWLGEESLSYDTIIKSFGYKYKSEWIGSYQGDIAAVFKDGKRKGYLVIGYGSCSGCDELESIKPWCYHNDEECTCDWSEVEKYRKSLMKSIRWNIPLPERDGNDWWAYDNEVMDWLKENY